MSEYFNVADIFGEDVFSRQSNAGTPCRKKYTGLCRKTIEEGKELDLAISRRQLQQAMKDWASRKRVQPIIRTGSSR